MFNATEIHSGDVLMDLTACENALDLIHHGMNDLTVGIGGRDFLQLIQAIILHDRILVDARSFAAWLKVEDEEFLAKINLKNIIGIVSLDDETYSKLSFAADQHANRVLKDPPIEIVTLADNEIKLYERLLSKKHTYDRDLILKEIAKRTALYFAISCHVGIPYLPGVVRIPFIEHELKTKFLYRKTANSTLNFLQETSKSLIAERNKILGSNIFRTKFPILFHYVWEKADHKIENVITSALELRETKEARAFRQLCFKIDEEAKSGNLQPLAELLNDLKTRGLIWAKKLEAPLFDVGIGIPASIEANPFQIWKFIQDKRKLHLLFLDKLFYNAIGDKKISPFM